MFLCVFPCFVSTSSEWAGPVESDLHVYSDNIHYCSTCHKAVRGEGKGIMHHCVFKQQWTYKLCTVNALADPESHAQSVSTELDGRETVFGGHGCRRSSTCQHCNQRRHQLVSKLKVLE